jgi:hypothetical protein
VWFKSVASQATSFGLDGTRGFWNVVLESFVSSKVPTDGHLLYRRTSAKSHQHRQSGAFRQTCLMAGSQVPLHSAIRCIASELELLADCSRRQPEARTSIVGQHWD